MADKIIGIDLGTTNSVVAVMEGSNGNVIVNKEGQRTTPSIVAFDKRTKELIVGELAKRQAVVNPENTFSSVKRFIGRQFKEIKDDLKYVTYKIIRSDNDNIKINCELIGKQLTPEEVSAQVLKKLAKDASTHLNQQVKKAVITVPAYFNDSQRQATIDAGKIAGLEVARIVNEPTAAALGYGLGKQMQNELILVFDLGGGTFDVSILEVSDGVFEVLSTAGDTHLGGDDFDNVLVKFLIKDFDEKENIDLSKDKDALQRLTEAAEKAKIELSSLESTNINIPFVTSINNEAKHINTTLNRSEFENLANSLIERCKIPVLNAIKDAKITKDQISEVVLVGGSTRIPAVKKLVKELINKVPNQSVNPDEVVAVGAAIQGGVLVGEVDNILLLDVTPLSLGVETYGGLMTRLIPRNTTVPTERTEIFTTASDNQPLVEIHILQGERQLADQNKSLGRFKLENIPLGPKGSVQIKVTFDIDVDGILSVKARELNTGLEQSIKIEGSSNLDSSEVEKIIKDSQEFEASDIEKKNLFQKYQEIEAITNTYKKELEKDEIQSFLSEDLKEESKKVFESAVSLIAKNPQANSIDDIKSEIEELYDSINSLSTKLTSIFSQLNLNPSNKDNHNDNEETGSDDSDVIDV